MKLMRIAIFVLLVTLIGGCSIFDDLKKELLVEETEIPETLAAQDWYTNSFLVSTDEVVEGHYAFRPWTEAYTMWIPTGATLDPTFYEKKEKHWERFLYGWEEKDENISYLLYGKFEDRPDSEEVGLDNLTFFSKFEGEYSKFEGEYSKSEDENNIYYYGKRISEVGDGKIPVYSDIGFIKHKTSGKSLGVLYEHNCSDWTTNCDANTERIEEHFWQLVKSVKFDE